jgi:hypothetical protein
VKKKPPPPPPPKRFASSAPDEFVIAQYAFTGQGQGDLSFREGDRIKIVKKTGTDQDWWVGELNGAKGSFPANYCKPAWCDLATHTDLMLYPSYLQSHMFAFEDSATRDTEGWIHESIWRAQAA